MPISIEEFDDYDPEGNRETNAERVIRFLVRNSDSAFRPAEIAEATGVHENSIQPVLNRLRSRGLVRHKEPYWAVGDLDAVRDAFMLHSAASVIDEELGPENRDEWLAAADGTDGDGG